MEVCPCGSARSYNECCEPYHVGRANAPTAEALMRSRYSAYVKKQIPYLRKTLTPDEQTSFDEASARDWAESAEWLGLEILRAYGKAEDKKGSVEFIARYKQDGIELAHRELSKFKKIGAAWYYVDGKIIPMLNPGLKVSRTAECPCGSGKKFKRCCGANLAA